MLPCPAIEVVSVEQVQSIGTADTMPIVRACTTNDAPAWDRFVESHPAGTYCHLAAWADIIERAYGLTSLRLRLEGVDGAWLGVFPVLVHRRYPFGPVQGTSLGFCNYGDVLVDPSVDNERAREMCLDACAQQGVHTVEVRAIDCQSGSSSEVTLRLAMQASTDELWQAIGAKPRNQIRKAEKLGLQPRWGREQLDVLYSIYAANMGRLGTPVHSARFFSSILDYFGDRCDILTVARRGTPMGAMLLVKHAGTWSDPFASTLVQYNDYNPGMLMYWEALRAACDAGASQFDFGRSHVGSGTFRFKRQWGAVPYPLRYRTFVDGLPVGTSVLTTYRGANAQLASRVWRRLPHRAQMVAGPFVRRWMP